jgi:NADPH:quinone reductase-like Zn-dependent oxidoreductase
MRAIRVHRFGGPEELVLEEVPRPQPAAGEVLVQVRAAGVLPIEWKVRQGLFAFPVTFPYTPGSAFAGVVAEVGPGVSRFAVGDAVFGRTTGGSYAEYTVTQAEPPALTPETLSLLARKPDALSFAQAATISGGASTAWSALFGDGELQAGQRVLIHGAAGGVGLFAVQFARWKGAHVIATASAKHHAALRALGVDTLIDYQTVPFEREVGEVDLVLDTIGGETLQRSMEVVRPGGTLISLLQPPDAALAEQRGIRAFKNRTLPTSADLEAIAQLISEGAVQAVVGRQFPLHQAAEAHRVSQTGHGYGRIVLLVE